MKHENINKHTCNERAGLEWAHLQGFPIIVDRHSTGQNYLALDDDHCVLARVSMTWKEYFDLAEKELRDVIKRLVADAYEAQLQRDTVIDIFDYFGRTN